MCQVYDIHHIVMILTFHTDIWYRQLIIQMFDYIIFIYKDSLFKNIL